MYGSEVSDQLIILRSREVMSPCTMSGTSSGTVLLVHPDGHAVQDANGIAWMAIDYDSSHCSRQVRFLGEALEDESKL